MQQYRGTLSVKSRACSNIEAHYQYNGGRAIQASRLSSFGSGGGGGGGHYLKYFPMNESLVLLIHQVKMVSSLWQVAKIN